MSMFQTSSACTRYENDRVERLTYLMALNGPCIRSEFDVWCISEPSGPLIL